MDTVHVQCALHKYTAQKRTCSLYGLPKGFLYGLYMHQYKLKLIQYVFRPPEVLFPGAVSHFAQLVIEPDLDHWK